MRFYVSIADPHVPLTCSHTRHPTGMALGSLSLNLALPTAFAATVAPIISSLVPRTTALDLTIPVLNDPKLRMAPRNRDENLESGALQLANGTSVLVDMRGIGEGKLGDTGELPVGVCARSTG